MGTHLYTPHTFHYDVMLLIIQCHMKILMAI